MYSIEKNIPIPVTAGRPSKYLVLKEMKKGDSFLASSGFVACIRHAAKAWDIKIVTRRETSSHHRIWRMN